MKKYCYFPRKTKRIIRSLQVNLANYRRLYSLKCDSCASYYDLWIDQLKVSNKLRKWLTIVGILYIILSLFFMAFYGLYLINL